MLNTYKYWQLLRQYVQHLVVCVYQPLFIQLSAYLDLFCDSFMERRRSSVRFPSDSRYHSVNHHI